MSRAKCSILVVDDEPSILQTLTQVLATEFEVLTVDSAEAAQELFSQRGFDIVLADHNLPGSSGVQLLDWVRQNSPQTMRIMMSGMARLEDVVDAINCGQVFRYLIKPWRKAELLQVVESARRAYSQERSHEQLLEELHRLNLDLERHVQERTRELAAANHQLEQRNSMLEKLALTDPLTGLPNRRAVDRVARSELLRRTRYPSALAIGIIDLDRFKEVNDHYLLPGGDQVLVTLAKTMAGAVRTVDSVGRIGGEEFLVVAPETDLDGAAVLAERIRSAIEQCRVHYKGDMIQVTASVGFAVAPRDVPADFDAMKYLASAALSEAKASGRNRCITRTLSLPASV